MPTTPLFGLRYPAPTDPADVPQDIHNLASDTETLASYLTKTYVPTWGSDDTAPVLGNGTLTGSYIQVGKLVLATTKLTIGSTSTLGTGTYYMSLPVQSAIWVFGTGKITDVSLGVASPVTPETQTATLMRALTHLSGAVGSTATHGVVTASGPIPWASGDLIELTIAYFAA